jgi:hypothetical protein
MADIQRTPTSSSAQPSPERMAQNNCPHGIPLCPICRVWKAEDELLRIVRALRLRLLDYLRLGGGR